MSSDCVPLSQLAQSHKPGHSHTIECIRSAQASSTFLLVPGEADGGLGGLLPRPALPAALVRDLRAQCPKLVVASNPARLRWGSQHIVLFRCDLIACLQALSLLPAAGGRLSLVASQTSLLGPGSCRQLGDECSSCMPAPCTFTLPGG